MLAYLLIFRNGPSTTANTRNHNPRSLHFDLPIYSARYAGEAKKAEDNMALVLEKLGHKTNRKAKFRTVIALVQGGKTTTFEGQVEGEITLEKSGEKGFGYDPIFQPEGFSKTFAEFTMAEKNAISHRGRAVAKFVDYLKANV